MKRLRALVPSRAGFRNGSVLWGTCFMLGLLPILTNFLENRYEVSVQDLVLPFIMTAWVATLVALVTWRPFRRDRLAGFLAAIMAMTVLSNGYDSRLGSIYSLISALVPAAGLGTWEAPVFSLIFIITIFILTIIAGQLLSRLVARHTKRSRDIMAALLIAITATFLFQFLPTAQTIAVAWPQYFYRPPALASTATSKDKATPDIYYIVLDRYASPTVLSSQFGFDNSDFLNFLSNNQYYVNSDSHQNYPYTTMSISSTLNANYQSDIINKFSKSTAQTIIPYHRAVQYGGVVSKLKSLGYQYDQIGTWYEATNQSPLSDNFYLADGQLDLLGHHSSLDGFPKGALQQSIFWRPIQAGLKLGKLTIATYQSQGQTDLTTAGLNTLKKYAASSTGGHFIFAHFIIPHDPYYYNADGSLSTTPSSDNSGEPIKQKYLGQVQYINSQMKSLLSTINTNSHGQAVVVLQADEGPYPIQLNDGVFDQANVDDEVNNLDMRSWSNTDLAMKYGNMAAYHIPAATPADLAAGANTLDVFRVILNDYFSDNLPYLSECYYAYPDGRQQTFVYDDVNKRLTGPPNPTCANNGTGPKP